MDLTKNEYQLIKELLRLNTHTVLKSPEFPSLQKKKIVFQDILGRYMIDKDNAERAIGEYDAKDST